MLLENKTTNEIQQEIFNAVQNGEDINKLKAEITERGLRPEGFYFTTETDYNEQRESASPSAHSSSYSPASSGASTGQIIIAIISLIILIIRIARCSSRM